MFPEPGLIIGRFMWIKYSSSLPPHHVPRSPATLAACFLTQRPPVVVSFRLRDDGQQDTGSASRPVRRLPRRDGGLPIPPQPPPRLRISRASTSVCVRRSFLNRRITQWLVRGVSGQFQSPLVFGLRNEWGEPAVQADR